MLERLTSNVQAAAAWDPDQMHFAGATGAAVIIRGLRAVSDF